MGEGGERKGGKKTPQDKQMQAGIYSKRKIKFHRTKAINYKLNIFRTIELVHLTDRTLQHFINRNSLTLVELSWTRIFRLPL